MQIHRLTEIVFALLKNERITARDLSERFEVSTRTIYRDIDVLSGCGIPIFTDKGNGGGISIAENYRIDKAMLSDSEKEDIITMLTAYNAAINSETTANLLDKLSGIFKTSSNFIEVDFSDWQNDESVQKNFETLKNCIIDKQVVLITYCNASGDEQSRELEPLKLIFKHRNWYLYAFCRLRKENRLFKLARVYSINIKNEHFSRVCLETNIAQNLEWKGDVLEITLKISKVIKNRVFDDFPKDYIMRADDGDYIVKNKMPMDDWVTGYILSFGDRAEVLEPLWLKEKIKNIHKSAAEK